MLDLTLPHITVCAGTFCTLSLLYVYFRTECWDLSFGYKASRARKGSEVLDTCKKCPMTGSDTSSIRKCEIQLTFWGNLQSMWRFAGRIDEQSCRRIQLAFRGHKHPWTPHQAGGSRLHALIHACNVWEPRRLWACWTPFGRRLVWYQLASSR